MKTFLSRTLALLAGGIVFVALSAHLIPSAMIGGVNIGERGYALVDLFVARADAQGTTLDKTTILGKLFSAGPVPVCTNCTIGVGSSSSFGKLTVTSGASNAVVTFATAWTGAPICWVVNTLGVSTNAVRWTTSTTALTITANTMATSDVLNYLCVGQQR